MAQTKEVDFAYATSTAANKFGYGRTGCWIVSVSKDGRVPAKAVSAHVTEAEAVEAANKLPMPFGWFHRKYELENA